MNIEQIRAVLLEAADAMRAAAAYFDFGGALRERLDVAAERCDAANIALRTDDVMGLPEVLRDGVSKAAMTAEEAHAAFAHVAYGAYLMGEKR